MDANDIITYWSVRLALVDFKTWVALSFVPIPILFIWALHKADRGAESTFKFIHFVTSDTGRGSPFALSYTILAIMCTWGIWALIVLDKLTEWYLGLVIGGFILGTLGARATTVTGRIKGMIEPPATAGDSDAPDAPLVTQETKTVTTVTVPQEAPPKPKAKPK